MAEIQDVPTEGACTWSAGLKETIGAACPKCGHTNLVHPSPGNPTLTSCVICEVLVRLPASPKEPT